MQPEPADAHELNPVLLLKKKASRLFSAVWSGVTKNISSICQKGQGVEFPGLGIFTPIEEAYGSDPEVTSTKLTMRALDTIHKQDASRETRLIINQTFLN
jgi:hypothetical protein